MLGTCEHYQVLGHNHPNTACYILCGADCAALKQRVEPIIGALIQEYTDHPERIPTREEHLAKLAKVKAEEQAASKARAEAKAAERAKIKAQRELEAQRKKAMAKKALLSNFALGAGGSSAVFLPPVRPPAAPAAPAAVAAAVRAGPPAGMSAGVAKGSSAWVNRFLDDQWMKSSAAAGGSGAVAGSSGGGKEQPGVHVLHGANHGMMAPAGAGAGGGGGGAGKAHEQQQHQHHELPGKENHMECS